jgi:hypothetical protein
MLVRENDCGRGANFIADTYAVLLSAKMGPEESLSSNNGWTGSEGIQVPNPSSPLPGLKQCFRKIAHQILRHYRTHLRELEICYTDRGLIIRGSARCYYGKQLAFHEVMRRTGMRVVANDIVVE